MCGFSRCRSAMSYCVESSWRNQGNLLIIPSFFLCFCNLSREKGFREERARREFGLNAFPSKYSARISRSFQIVSAIGRGDVCDVLKLLVPALIHVISPGSGYLLRCRHCADTGWIAWVREHRPLRPAQKASFPRFLAFARELDQERCAVHLRTLSGGRVKVIRRHASCAAPRGATRRRCPCSLPHLRAAARVMKRNPSPSGV